MNGVGKKQLKRHPPVEEKKSGFSFGWVPIAIVVFLFVGGIVWFFVSGSTPAVPLYPVEELVDSGHVKGNSDALVTVVEFSDFQCPACGAAFPTVENVFNQYKDKIRLVYRHFPLTTIHPFAVSAAEASECAARQNKFWEMYTALFEQQGVWTAALDTANAKQRIREIAIGLGVNATDFDQCLSSRAQLSKVQADLDAGAKFGINSTPTFFINSKKFAGGLSQNQFSQEIDAALASAK